MIRVEEPISRVEILHALDVAQRDGLWQVGSSVLPALVSLPHDRSNLSKIRVRQARREGWNLDAARSFEARHIAHDDVAAVSFTGGTATGKHVAATAAGSFKKLSLELGGKNATIVFADADVEAAAKGAARAAFTNTGQICLCGSRLLVQRPIYDAFMEAFCDAVRAMLERWAGRRTPQ